MIRLAKKDEATQLVAIFSGIIENSVEYISHGEIQMGIATGPNTLHPHHRTHWEKYLLAQFEEFPEGIWVHEESGQIAGFIIFLIDKDMYKPFGVVNDLCVLPEYRKKGIGGKLLDKAFLELEKLGIKEFYLESGLQNHLAHAFFEKRGFKAVSKIFRKA